MFQSLAFRASALAALVSAALIALLGGLYVSTLQTREATAWVDHTQRVIEALNRVTSPLHAAEAGQRGFVLTRDPAFIAKIDDDIAEAQAAARDLVALTADNGFEHQRTTYLHRLIDQRATWLHKTVDIARSGDFDKARAGIGTGKGRQLMDTIDGQADLVLAEERRLMALRAGRIDDMVSNIGLLLFIGGPAIIALLVGFVAMTVRQIGRPTNAIIAAMERLAGGADEAQVATRQATREFSRLAAGYNALAERIHDNDRQRRRADAALQATNAELAASAHAAASRGAAIERLASMSHRMQAARTDEEMATILAAFVPQVLVGSAGVLYAFNNSRNQLVAVASWGGHAVALDPFAPDACWALRRGQSHSVDGVHGDIRCAHIEPGATPYHCEPLLAGGNVIGLLQLDGQVAEEDRFLLNALAENIASALVNHRLQRGLHEQTIRDPLTGLYNRRYMEETLAHEIAIAARREAPLTLVMCDVDNFKRCNDEFGHSSGDAVLQAVAIEMQRHFRGGDVVCRYGGEEFAIIAPAAAPQVIAERVERLREAIASLQIRDGNKAIGPISMSFGVSGWDAAIGDDATALVRQSDGALYRAKREGRNRTVVELQLAA
jgi:diguanylate cyclase (GGDEF)-like protein